MSSPYTKPIPSPGPGWAALQGKRVHGLVFDLLLQVLFFLNSLMLTFYFFLICIFPNCGPNLFSSFLARMGLSKTRII
jgi:hypothetical protein